jgi:endonuclease/exonuclease/phosphatase family metal-dependent hydrolase
MPPLRSLLLLLCCSPALFFAQPDIVIDGRFDDWSNISPAVVDLVGDVPPGATDLLALHLADDADYLYFFLQLNTEILWQEGNQLTLYLDTDDDPATGGAVGGLGAEVSFTFGERQGYLLAGGDTIPLEFQHLGLAGAPSTYSAQLEWALAWDALTDDGHRPLSRGPLRLVIVDEAGGDRLPAAGGFRYVPQLTPRPPVPAVDFSRADPAHLRLVSHNVNRRHFDPEKRDAFTRIYRALQPDLLLLEEAYEGSAEAILDYFRPALPPARSGQWYAYKAGEEATVLLSPYPANMVIGLGNSAAYLLQRPDQDTAQLALIALSMPCCRQDSARQAEADLIMAFVRDLRTPGGIWNVPEGTPIILAGDANLVGYRSQYHTLREGIIQDTLTHGPPFAPDWDSTALTDLHPPHFQRPFTFTWRGSGYFPGRLDYVFYTDSVLDIGRYFVFDTVGLPATTLDRYNLQESDAPDTYKHLPLVVDLVWEE